ncbi:DUF6808 domain-containing protein [Bacteroides fragilis]|uniref:DUF6808 domain-containing protein n=1 Tax=Bacteroides TaxID=816 RepID=UPI001C704877|nr:hypothetical protein [Bacteroides fragilis]MBW9277406.1 hypothetical protein [Bacteroides fragilis]
MKYLPYIIIIVLILFIVFRPARVEHVSGEVVRDTVTVIDTVRDTVPKPYRVEVVRMDTFYLPIFVGDSLEVDSVPVVLPIEKKEYKTNEYRAVISGFHPNLDFIETYIKSQIVTVTSINRRRKRFGLGVQAGYGFSGNKASPYIGVGVSCNLWEW